MWPPFPIVMHNNPRCVLCAFPLLNNARQNDNIIMEKDNTESSLKFNFKLNKKCEGNYFIKQLNSYLDTEILTNQLIIDENRIYIEYELWIQEEYAGLFKYEIIIKEM